MMNLKLFVFSLILMSSQVYGDTSSVIKKNLIKRDRLLESAIDFSHPKSIAIQGTTPALNAAAFDYNQEDIQELSLNFLKDAFLTKRTNSIASKHKKSQKHLIYTELAGEISALVPTSPMAMTKVHKKLNFKFLKTTKKGKRPLMIVFPPIMGNTFADIKVAKKLVKAGANVILAQLPNFFEEGSSFEGISVDIFQNIILIKMLIDQLISDKEYDIDRDRVGAFGISLGGIIAATLTGALDTVDYAYIVCSGGNFGDITEHSQRASIVKFREAEFKNNPELIGLSPLERSEVWNEKVKRDFSMLDPVYYGHKIDPQKAYIIMSTNDKTIPFRNQLELWQALGSPEYELSRFSHISSIVRWTVESTGHAVKFLLGK